MALNATKASIIRKLSARAYSQVAPICGTFNYQVQSTVLPNKTVVASADNESPIARVSILFRAGSRYETADNLGTVHVLRIAAGLSTCNSSQFAIMRNIQQNGAVLSCTTSREFIAYTLEGTRKAIEECMPYLTDVATEQAFKPWEISDNVHRLKLDLATRPPQQRAIDLLHKAAYRRGLGNSIYISKNQMGKISSETLQHYVASNFVSNKAAVVGLGVNHTELVNYAQSLELENGRDEAPASKYKGGEVRSDKGGDLAYVAIAGEACGTKNPKEVVAFHILRYALGVGAPIKRANENQSVLAKSLGNLGEPHALGSFLSCYQETGLLGMLAIGSPAAAPKLIETAVKVLKSGRVNDADVARAKNQMKVNALSNLESGSEAIEFLGKQALDGSIVSPGQLEALIDSITTADVDAALKKVSNSRLSVAAYGNLSTVPYLDEMKKHKPDKLAYVAIGKEGVHAKHAKEIFTFEALKFAIGAGSCVKGGRAQTLLAKNIHEGRPHALIAFNHSYYDSGIFGVLCIGAYEIMQTLLENTVLTLKTLKMNEELLEKGKNQLKTNLINRLESGAHSIDFISRYALISELVAPCQVAEIVDSISLDDINLAASKVSGGALSIGAYGNLSKVPYLDDLK